MIGRRSKTVYIAAPLFNAAEREHNVAIREALQPWLWSYLPQIDGSLLPNLLSAGLSPTEAHSQVFHDDIEAVKSCDALLIVLNGRTIDEGAAFELGVAWSIGKTCVGYKDDFRQLTTIGDNPMIETALSATYSSLDELRRWAEEFSAKP